MNAASTMPDALLTQLYETKYERKDVNEEFEIWPGYKDLATPFRVIAMGIDEERMEHIVRQRRNERDEYLRRKNQS